MTRAHLTVRLEAEALLEQEPHVERGGMFVPAPAEARPEPMSTVVVHLRTPVGDVNLSARVVQVIPDGGVGLEFDDIDRARARLGPLMEAARAGRPRQTNLRREIGRMTTIEKQELASSGDRPSRMLLAKDPNKAIHPYVLRNHKLTSEEVQLMASFRGINPAALEKIAENRVWMANPRIVVAIVANPKAPPALALRLLDRLKGADLRRIAKSNDVPRIVAHAARRKMPR